MVSMTEDFRALAEDILSSARGRQQVMTDVKSGVAELVAGTRRFLRDCNDHRRAGENEVHQEAEALRQQLADGNNARLEAFDRMHQRVTGLVAGLVREVRCRLDERHTDSLSARAVWSELAMVRSGVKKAPGREQARSRKGHS